MDKTEMTALLHEVAAGNIRPEDAALKLKMQPFQEIGEYAKVDFHRGIRQGVPEVIYGAGKTKEHILGIAQAMVKNGQQTVLITRLTPEAADFVRAELPLKYDELSKTGVIGELPKPTGKGRVVVATGGTSDIPVAEEAAVTAEVLGNEVVRLYDVGVSGIHRLLSHMDIIMSAQTVTPILLGLMFNRTGAWRTLPVYSCVLTVLSFIVFTALVKNIKARKVENVVGLEALDGD